MKSVNLGVIKLWMRVTIGCCSILGINLFLNLFGICINPVKVIFPVASLILCKQNNYSYIIWTFQLH